MPRPTATLTFSGQHNFASDFSDAPGEFSVSRVGGDAALTFPTSLRGRLTVGLAAERSVYSFTDATGFVSGVAEPWDDMMTAQASVRFARQHDEHWSYWAAAEVVTQFQDHANFGDSITWGGRVGAMYAQGPTLAYGLSLSFRTGLEDDTGVYPLPIIRWQICERWSFETGPSPTVSAAVQTYQGAVTYHACEDLSVSLAIGAETRNFRLADDGASPNGVARDWRVPVTLSADWRVHPQVRVTGHVGANFSQQLTLDDEGGDRVSQLDADMGFFAGVGVKIDF